LRRKGGEFFTPLIIMPCIICLGKKRGGRRRRPTSYQRERELFRLLSSVPYFGYHCPVSGGKEKGATPFPDDLKLSPSVTIQDAGKKGGKAGTRPAASLKEGKKRMSSPAGFYITSW